MAFRILVPLFSCVALITVNSHALKFPTGKFHCEESLEGLPDNAIYKTYEIELDNVRLERSEGSKENRKFVLPYYKINTRQLKKGHKTPISEKEEEGIANIESNEKVYKIKVADAPGLVVTEDGVTRIASVQTNCESRN